MAASKKNSDAYVRMMKDLNKQKKEKEKKEKTSSTADKNDWIAQRAEQIKKQNNRANAILEAKQNKVTAKQARTAATARANRIISNYQMNKSNAAAWMNGNRLQQGMKKDLVQNEVKTSTPGFRDWSMYNNVMDTGSRFNETLQNMPKDMQDYWNKVREEENERIRQQQQESKDRASRIYSNYQMNKKNQAAWKNGNKLQQGMEKDLADQKKQDKPAGFKDWSMYNNVMDESSRFNQLMKTRPKQEQEYWQGVKDEANERIRQQQDRTVSMQKIGQMDPASRAASRSAKRNDLRNQSALLNQQTNETLQGGQGSDGTTRPYNEQALQNQMADKNSPLNQIKAKEDARYANALSSYMAANKLLSSAYNDLGSFGGDKTNTYKMVMNPKTAQQIMQMNQKAQAAGIGNETGDIYTMDRRGRREQKQHLENENNMLTAQRIPRLQEEYEKAKARWNDTTFMAPDDLEATYGEEYRNKYDRYIANGGQKVSLADYIRNQLQEELDKSESKLTYWETTVKNNNNEIAEIDRLDKNEEEYSLIMDPNKRKAQVTQLQAEISDLEQQIADVDAHGGPLAARDMRKKELRKQIQDKQAELSKWDAYTILDDDIEDDATFHAEYDKGQDWRQGRSTETALGDSSVHGIYSYLNGGSEYEYWKHFNENEIDAQYRGAMAMSDEEKGMFNKLYNAAISEGREPTEAKAFMDALQPYLNQRLRTFEELKNRQEARTDPVTASYKSAMSGLLFPVYAAGTMIGRATGADYVNDPNNAFFGLARYQGDVEGQVAKDLGNVGGYFYKAGMSAVKNFLRSLPYAGAGQLTGEIGTLAGFFGEDYYTTYQQKLDETGSADKAGLYAMTDAVISTFFEIASVEKTFQPTENYLMKFLQIAGAEMSEELSEGLFGQYIHELFDGSNEWKDNAAAIIKAGGYEDENGNWVRVTEDNANIAMEKALKDYSAQVLESVTSAGISAGGPAAFSMVRGKALESNYNRELGNKALNRNVEKGMTRPQRYGEQTESFNKLKEAAQLMPEDSEARKIADQIDKENKNKNKFNARQVGRLVRAIVNESSEQIGEIAKNTLGDSLKKELLDAGEHEQEAEMLSRILADGIVAQQNSPAMWMAISGNENAKRIWNEYRDSEAAKEAQAQIQPLKIAQKSVMDLIVDPKEYGVSAEGVAGMMKGAQAATAEDIAEADAQGRRTGSALEVIADGLYGEITGFTTENVQDKDGKNQSVVMVQIGEGASARTVDISQVKGLTDGAAQALQVIGADRGQVIGNETAKALLQIASKAKDVTGAVTDAMNTMWAAVMEQKAPKTNLDTKTQETIANAVRADMDAAEAERVQNWRAIKPGQGTTTFNGFSHGTQEFNDAIGKLGKTHLNEANVIGNYAKSMGMDVQLYYDEKESAKQGAFYGGKDGAGIRINLAGTINQEGAHRSAVATFAHEATHNIEANSPWAYKALRSFVLQNLEKAGIDLQNALQHIMDNYAAHGESIDLNGAIAELVAMGSEQVLTNEDLAAKLKEQDPKLMRRVQKAVSDLVNRIRGVKGDVLTTSSRYARALMNVTDEMAKKWLAAYEEAKETTAPATGTASAKKNAIRIDVEDAINNPNNYNDYFTYDNLTKKSPIKVTKLTLNQNLSGRNDYINAGIQNAEQYGYKKDGNVYVHVDDTDTEVMVTKNSMDHTPVRLTDIQRPIFEHIGEMLKNAKLYNTAYGRKTNHIGTYMLLGAGVMDDGSIVYAAFNVNKYTHKLDTFDVLYSIKAENKEAASNKTASLANSRYATASTISIADAFDDVKDGFANTLPQDVLDHFGVARRVTKDTHLLQHSFSDENATSDENTIRDENGDVMAEVLPGGTITKYSWASWQNEDIDELTRQLIARGFDKKDVTKWIKDVNGVAAMIAANRDVLDYEASPYFTMLKNNQEYVKTLDASTLCAKRLLYQGIFNEIQHLLPNTPILPDDLIKLVNMMKKRGLVTPCGICYVESRRRMLGKYAEKWLETYDGEYKPTLDQVTTTDGLEALRESHPQTYQDFVDAMNAKGSANPKVVQLRTDYRGEIKKLTDSQVTKVKEIGGLRVQSFSDFEIVHMIDMMQAVMDMAAMDLTSQAYTKVPEFAWVFGDTGIKINLSLIGEGTGLDENGNLIFSSTEGMDFDEAMALRKRYSKNVGTILVGMNDAHVIAAMGDSRIDFIIPFHKSGWSKKEMARVSGMSAYKDYTRWQNEKKLGEYTQSGYKTIPNKKSKISNFGPVNPSQTWDGQNGYWDFSKTGRENAEEYLRLCKEDGRVPKFANFLVYDGDGGFMLPAGDDQRSRNIREGYWKMLIDFKMYDNSGKGSPQTTVQPKFNMKAARDILTNYDGNVRELPTDHEVAKEFVKEYKDEHPGRKVYSIRDDRYEDAVKEGDTELAQWMVDQVAEANMEGSKVRGKDGKLLKMYHGTGKDFNEFKREYIGSTGRFEGSGFNFTPFEGRAASYGKNVLAGYLNIQNPLSAEKKTISIAKLAQIIREADPTGDNIIANYARETRDYGNESFIRRESLTAARNIWEASDNDVDIYSDISAADSDAEGLIAKFEQLGYDGLIHYDDNGNIKTAIAFSSEQFKRADPVTYDDDGKMIPLSERFDTGKQDIRWSMQDDTDYDVKAWMETVPEWSLRTEAEKALLRNYGSLRRKNQMDGLRMEKIDAEIKRLEGMQGKSATAEGTPVTTVTVDEALKAEGIQLDGVRLKRGGVTIGTLKFGVLNVYDQYRNIRNRLTNSGAFEYDEKLHDWTTKVQNIHADEERDIRTKLEALRIKKQNLQGVMDQTSEQLAQITGSEGFGAMMYQQRKVLDKMDNFRTQKELTDAVKSMEAGSKRVQGIIDENRRKAEELAGSDVVKQFRTLLGTTTADKTAADLKKEFSSTWTKTQIREFLDPIILKMKSGEDFTQDVETLAGILVNSDSRNGYEELEALRGLTITLGKGAQAELRAKNSSLKEIRARLAGTGITVKYGERSTLEADIEDLRAEYPMIPELGDEKDALENFVSWVEGMKNQSAGNEFYDQRIAEAMAMITGKAAGAAKGIYMPNDPKAQRQVLAMMDFVKALNAETQQAQEALQQVADEMESMRKAGKEASGKADVLMRDVNVALDYYNRISRIAVEEAKQKRNNAMIEQLKSETAQKIIKNNEEWRQLIQRDADARKQLEDNRKAAAQINTSLKRMYNLLKNPKGTKNIPEYMQGLAREVLGIFAANDADGGRRFLNATKDGLAEMQRLLTAWEKQDGPFNPADLAAAEEAVVINLLQDLDIIRDGIAAINTPVKGKNKLDTLQQRGITLGNIRDAVGEIYSAIRAEQEVQIGDRRVAVEDAAYKVAAATQGKNYREWTGKLGGVVKTLHKAIISGNMTPEYFFRTVGNEGLSDLWDAYHWAENKNGLELAKAQKRLGEIAKAHGFDQWDMGQKIKLDLESGETELTLGQVMSLWATWKRERTLGPQMSEHLTKGGFFAEKDLRDGWLGRTTIERKAHRVTEADMDKVKDLMTDEQRKFVDDVVLFMSRDMSQLGNEASMAAYGIKMYKEAYYFPFQMWDGVKSRKSNDAGSAAGANDRAFHPSFSKSRMHGANNALVIGDFMQTAADHIAGMINYATMGLANESMQKVLNQQTAQGPYETKRNTRAILEEAYGREVMQYLAELQNQLNGGAVRTTRTWADRAVSLFRKNAVAGSLSVALQQPLSYIRAAMMISPKYLTRAALSEYWKDSYKQRMQYSGVSVIKEMGRFDMALGQSAREYLTPDGKESTGRKIWEGVKEYSTILPELMDRWTWNRMWVAVKAEQHALHPEMDVKSDEFLQMVGERFNELMRRTQVYDSVLVKSANMRNDHFFMKQLTSFMAEPTLTVNVLADAVREAASGAKGGKLMLAKAGATFILSAVLQAAFKGLMSSGRTPDEKKTWFENFMYRFFANAMNELDPLQLIPGYSDLVTLLKDGKLQDDAMGAIGKIFTAGQKGVDLLLGNGGKNGVYRDIEDSVGQLVQLFSGLPLKNLMRDARAMWNWVVDQPYAKRPDDWNSIKYQTIDTFMNADNLWGVLMEKLGESGYDTSNAGYYQRIYAAKKAGDEQAAQDMIDYLLNGKGVKQETIDKQLVIMAKNDSSMTADEKTKIIAGEGEDANSTWWKLDRDEYKKQTGKDPGSNSFYYRLKDAINNNSAEEIKRAVNDLLEHGFDADRIKDKLSDWKSEYLEADADGKRKIRDAIQKAYKLLGLTAEEADKVINKWKKDNDSGSQSGGGGGGRPEGVGRMPKRPKSEADWDQYMDDLDEYWANYDFSKNDPVGRYGEGTIDMNNRKVVNNADGSISTERSFSFYDEDTGKEILIPLIVDGKVLTKDEAIDHYYETVEKGKPEYLGMFDDWKDADEYAVMLHNRGDWYYHR